ncbi:MAG: hypothetical protein ACOYKE_15360 [Ferruginibacter sp.]
MMLLIPIGIDYVLHYYKLVTAGLYFGIAGTILIIASLAYSARKRKWTLKGSTKKLLVWHEYLSWIGFLLIMVHAGIHFNALLPWLAVLMMCITVGSGLVGKYLLKDANEALKQKKQVLINNGMTAIEAEKTLFVDALTVDLMKKWRIVHLPITLIFGLLVLIHLFTIILYSK